MTPHPGNPPSVDAPALVLAAQLLGSVLWHGEVAVRITEVEAYEGADDPGSHAFRGRTERNRAMFGPAGHLYVYFTYGMHHCANYVCGPEGTASACLLRAGEVVEGVDVARSRRPKSSVRDLARGPARLTKALAIDAAADGADLHTGGELRWEWRPAVPSADISTGPRVGVSGPGGGPEYPWRLWITGDPSVSPYRAAKPRRRPHA